MATSPHRFTVEPVTPHSWRKRLGVGALGLVSAAVLVGGLYRGWLNAPVSMPQTLDDAREVMRSARFANLSPERRAEYLERVRALVEALPEAERWAVMREFWGDEAIRESMWEAMRTQTVQRARTFAVADADEQKQMIDQMINEMLAMHAMFQRGGPSGGGAALAAREVEPAQMTDEERRQRDEARQQRMQERQREMTQELETGNPQDRELVGQMMRVVGQEMERRGIDMGWGRR